MAEKKFVPRPGQVDFTNVRWAPVINCVLRYQDRFLVVQRSSKLNFYPNCWNGISGFLDDKKSLKEKVETEIKEETGIGKENIVSVKLGEIFHQEAKEYEKTWIVHPILVEVAIDEVKLGWEAQDFQWVSLEKIFDLELLPGFDEVVKRIKKML